MGSGSQALRMVDAAIGRFNPERVMGAIANMTESLLDTEFAAHETPYGESWPARSDGAPALTRFRRHITVTHTGWRLRVTITHPGARAHNYGAVIFAKYAPALRFKLPNGTWCSKRSVVLPQRRMVPGNSGMPSRWRSLYLSAIRGATHG